MATFTDVRKLCACEIPNPIKLAQSFDHATNKAWREYEPDELYAAGDIKADDQYRKDLLCACQMAVTNPDCFDVWHAFHHVATAFNNRRASFEFLDAISYMEAAWACTVLRTLNPYHDFGLGVQRYISALCMTDGVLFFPWVSEGGLDLCTFYPLMGMLENDKLKSVMNTIKDKWKSGALSTLAPSDVNDSDVAHVQMAKIVNCAEYIRRNQTC